LCQALVTRDRRCDWIKTKGHHRKLPHEQYCKNCWAARWPEEWYPDAVGPTASAGPPPPPVPPPKAKAQPPVLVSTVGKGGINPPPPPPPPIRNGINQPPVNHSPLIEAMRSLFSFRFR
jgi:hypothetical protein